MASLRLDAFGDVVAKQSFSGEHDLAHECRVTPENTALLTGKTIVNASRRGLVIDADDDAIGGRVEDVYSDRVLRWDPYAVGDTRTVFVTRLSSGAEGGGGGSVT